MRNTTPKQKAFIDNYCSKTSETFGNAAKSYEKAYKTDKMTPRGIAQSACRMLTKDNIIQEIDEYTTKIEQKTEIKREYILTGLQDQYSKADTAKDRTNALRALQLMGQSIALFTDNLNTNITDQQQELDEQQQAMARRIAKVSLSAG